MKGTFLSPDTRGQTPLWLVFWVYGVLVSHLYFGAILYFYPRLETLAMAALLAGFVVYTAFITRAVWINVGNTHNETLGEISRYLTVAWAMNSVLVCGFLFLDHFRATEPKLPLPF
jgi:uncharacterized membrane protein HdeD (DUF308 family)